jgi:hypothetical protein
MIVRHFRRSLLFGLLAFVGLVVVGYISLPLENLLTLPASKAAGAWHAAGFPPKGEAAFLLPPIFTVLESYLIGLLIAVAFKGKAQTKTKS